MITVIRKECSKRITTKHLGNEISIQVVLKKFKDDIDDELAKLFQPGFYMSFDIKREAKSKTREQFFEERLADEYCPKAYGLRNVFRGIRCKGTFSCRRCWEEATKNISFAGDNENRWHYAFTKMFHHVADYYHKTEGIFIYNALWNDDRTITFEFHAPGCSSEYVLTTKEIDIILNKEDPYLIERNKKRAEHYAEMKAIRKRIKEELSRNDHSR